MHQNASLTLIQRLALLHEVSDPVADYLEMNVQQENHPKGTVLLDTGEIQDRFYYVEQGLARKYYQNGQEQVTVWFRREGDFLTSNSSFRKQLPSHEVIELLEDARLLSLSYEALQELFHKYPETYLLDNELMLEYTLLAEEVEWLLRLSSAEQKYLYLMDQHPWIPRRVKQGPGASFLKMRNETLSRVRANVRYH